jgi:hypothetical protein
MDVKQGPNVQPARLHRESAGHSGPRGRRQTPPPPNPVPDIPIPNPLAICEPGPDGWTLLVNPDNAAAIATNPTGALIWKLTNGRRTVADIVAAVRRRFPDAPGSVEDDVTALLTTLSESGLIGREIPLDPRRRTKDQALIPDDDVRWTINE